MSDPEREPAGGGDPGLRLRLDDLSLGPGDALFLDFDGTLAELGPDPAAIRLPQETAAALGRLAARLGGALALLSGRDLRDLATRVPERLWRAGNHGLAVAAPGAALPGALPPPDKRALAPLEALAARRPGVRVELKGPVIAVHYRAAPEAGEAAIAAAREAAAAAPGHVCQKGKMVVEVKPAAANKGAALRGLAAGAPFAGRRIVMIGDDVTDEDAMRAALALGGTAVKVGDGDSVAPYRAASPAALRAWIARQAG